jgi:hypothetical protein
MDEKAIESLISLEEDKTVTRLFYEEVGNTGNLDIIESIIAPDYTEGCDGKRFCKGIEGAKAHVAGVRRTYPDLHIVVERQIAEGEWWSRASPQAGPTKGSGWASSLRAALLPLLG